MLAKIRPVRAINFIALLLFIGLFSPHDLRGQVTAANDASQIAQFARTDQKLEEPAMAIAFATGDLGLLTKATALDGIAGATGNVIFGTRGVTSLRARRWALAQIAFLNYRCTSLVRNNFRNEMESGIDREVQEFAFSGDGITFRYVLVEGDAWANAAIKDANRLVQNVGCSPTMLAYSRNLIAAVVGRSFPVTTVRQVVSSFDQACQQERAKVVGRVTFGVRNHCTCLVQTFGTAEYDRTGSIQKYFEWILADNRRSDKWIRVCFQHEG